MLADAVALTCRAQLAMPERRSDRDGLTNQARPHHHPSDRRAGDTVLRRVRVLPVADQGDGRGEPLLAAADLSRPGHRQDRALLPELRRQDAAAQHPGRHLHRQRQAATDAPQLAPDEERPLREGPRRHRSLLRRHRLRHVHAPAHRPRRLEHAPRQRPLGADLPEGPLSVRRARARLLDRRRRRRIRRVSPGSRIPCCRSWPPSARMSSRAITG